MAKLKMFWTRQVLLLCILYWSSLACAQSSGLAGRETVLLWPHDDVATTSTEETLPFRGNNVIRITNVTQPSMTVYRASVTTSPAPAILVCPGGGYKILAINIEGSEIADWLNSLGITAFVLKYRVPQNREGAFADAQRAMGLIRAGAEKWDVDPGKIGIIGFSAGGHLAARTSTNYGRRSYEPVDAADALSSRPDFTILIYPAYVADQQYGLADEIKVTSTTPATFVVQTQDDSAHIPSALVYSTELTKAGVECEFHMYPKGGHGYGMRKSEKAVSEWPRLCEEWLSRRGVIARQR